MLKMSRTSGFFLFLLGASMVFVVKIPNFLLQGWEKLYDRTGIKPGLPEAEEFEGSYLDFLETNISVCQIPSPNPLDHSIKKFVRIPQTRLKDSHAEIEGQSSSKFMQGK